MWRNHSKVKNLQLCNYYVIKLHSYIQVGTAMAQWLRFCATNRSVASSIPDGVIGIFHWHKILPIALWSWGRLSLKQKWVPGVFPVGKGNRWVRLLTYHHPVPLSRNMGVLTSWNPVGHSRPVMGLLYLYFYLYTHINDCTWQSFILTL